MSSISGQGWWWVDKWPALTCDEMLGWWNGEVGGWYQRFRGCTCSFAEDEVAWWDNYSWVWTYQERQGDLFALSTYFDWSKVRDIPWNNLVPPDFCATRRAEIICWVSENKQPFKFLQPYEDWMARISHSLCWNCFLWCAEHIHLCLNMHHKDVTSQYYNMYSSL